MALSIRKVGRRAHLSVSAVLIWTILILYFSQCLVNLTRSKYSDHLNEGETLQTAIYQREDSPNSTSHQGQWASSLREQFRNPQEILAILLILGGDILQKACAQLTGSRGGLSNYITPVAFSFGWVAYAFRALMSVFGDGNLMPLPDTYAVVAAVGGQLKVNESWVIGRLIRDLEITHKHRPIGGVRVVFYQTNGKGGNPRRDYPWMAYFLFTATQITVSAIPVFDKRIPIFKRNWSILIVTAAGTILALATASLPQWRKEKFSGRKNGKGSYILTRGNGHSHIFVIRVKDEDRGFVGEDGKWIDGFINMDDLAVARFNATRETEIYTIILTILWIILLLTVGSIEEDRWYILMVGLIGMVHNLMAAGLKRKPDAHGIPLLEDEEIKNKVEPGQPPRKHYIDFSRGMMQGLQEAENLRAGVGLAVLDTFFPNGLQPHQKLFWDRKREEFEKLSKLAEAKKDVGEAALASESAQIRAQTQAIQLHIPVGSSNQATSGIFLQRMGASATTPDPNHNSAYTMMPATPPEQLLPAVSKDSKYSLEHS